MTILKTRKKTFDIDFGWPWGCHIDGQTMNGNDVVGNVSTRLNVAAVDKVAKAAKSAVSKVFRKAGGGKDEANKETPAENETNRGVGTMCKEAEEVIRRSSFNDNIDED